MRTRLEIMGRRFLPKAHRAELERANDVTTRMCSLLLLAHRVGTQFIIENPADRGNLDEPKLFLNAEHGPLWLFPAVLALAHRTSAKLVTFAMCAFGAPWQKATTLMYTAGYDAWLDVLISRTCEHDSHPKMAGGDKTPDGWNSHETAAYPADFNSYLAQATAAMLKQRGLGEATSDAPIDATPDDSKLDARDPTVERTQAEAPSPPVKHAPEAGLSPSRLRADAAKFEPAKRLTFAEVENDHDEPDLHSTDADLAPVPVPAAKPRRKGTFERTAGARATRSQSSPR